MALTQCDVETNVISALHDRPITDDNLSPSQFKGKFDQACTAIKNYINNTLLVELNAALSNIVASKLKTARDFTISDSDGTNTGAAVSFDGSANKTLKLPSAIKASLTGNADTATKLKTARSIGGASFDGSAGITLAQMGAMPTSGGTFSGAVEHSGKVTFNRQIVLSSYDYGTTLPAAGTAGRLFFKKV